MALPALFAVKILNNIDRKIIDVDDITSDCLVAITIILHHCVRNDFEDFDEEFVHKILKLEYIITSHISNKYHTVYSYEYNIER